MNEKELTAWLEDRGDLLISKADGEPFVVMARDVDGMLKTSEAQTLIEAVCLWEEI